MNEKLYALLTVLVLLAGIMPLILLRIMIGRKLTQPYHKKIYKEKKRSKTLMFFIFTSVFSSSLQIITIITEKWNDFRIMTLIMIGFCMFAGLLPKYFQPSAKGFEILYIAFLSIYGLEIMIKSMITFIFFNPIFALYSIYIGILFVLETVASSAYVCYLYYVYIEAELNEEKIYVHG